MATTSKPKPFRWIPYAFGAVFAALIVVGLRPQPVPVETARVVVGPLRATVSEEGKTRIKQRYVVAAPVSGQLRRIAFKPGAEVEAGVTVVAVIDPLPASPLDERTRALAEARRDTARVQVEKSRTAHELARNELRRIEQMFAAKTISPQELESAQARETAAARDVVAAEGALRSAEAELSTSAGGPVSAPAGSTQPIEVRANATGRILHVFQESVRAVAQGTPLLEIGDPADLEVVVEMLSRDGAAIAAGAPVSLEQWGGPTALEGRVRLVEPAAFTKYSALGVEEQRVNVVVDITSPREAWRSLGDNFRVEARVITWESDRALKVPVSGLFRQGNAWAAYVVRSGKAELVPVEAGKSGSGEIQITGGLQEGDEVILYPGDRIKDGQRVKPTKV
ncbi:efflux RND transporter periplasmic adaptor subunit [Oleiharenicola lentus]|jgi:HlyD family secretion protein|uniref:Efflux RND transporter periplasmic adaptor subunit n=1 Tax=Oleiharenicola lentus TaxID=2508720 RepID=A0A4Q1C439_9BACT|nr:efflux RND transporter periplasmic adaptor subunit [Oleiharenicola lentus]RXK53147.1 efflux RND transporter periplasmic adaptor subunit [Oleiharenicola lentus]